MVSFLHMEIPDGLSLREKAYRIIRNQIVTCELPPGSPLNERELVEMIGVSRTPIREALNRLENERLVSITSQKGATATAITPAIIRDIYQLRDVLEPYVVSMVTPTFSETALLEFQQGFAQKSPGKYEELIALDSQLHYSIISAFGNEYLNKLMENMYTQNERIRRLSTLIPQRIDESFNEHLLIVEAMLARDPQKAADAMRAHLTTAQNVAFLL